jgi:putative membrane protein
MSFRGEEPSDSPMSLQGEVTPDLPSSLGGGEGLQGERTRLAWVRTAALLAVTGLGGAGLALRTGTPAIAIIPFAPAVFCGALLLTGTGIRYRNAQDAIRGGRPLDNRVDALIAWLGTLAVTLGALSLVLTR